MFLTNFLHQNVLQNTLIFVGECSVLRFKVSSALKLLGNSSVGVMDPQNHCAVVTLVVSNCLKKLMSHSCPFFVLCTAAVCRHRHRCRRTRKRCRDSWIKYICPRHEFKPKSFLTSVTIIVDLVLSLAAQSQQAYQVMGIDGNVR
jgi:hypothetical protein